MQSITNRNPLSPSNINPTTKTSKFLQKERKLISYSSQSFDIYKKVTDWLKSRGVEQGDP